MKRNVRIVILLIILYFIIHNLAYTQINIPKTLHYKSVDIAIDSIRKVNSQIERLKIQTAVYENPRFALFYFLLIRDGENNFIDIIFLKKWSFKYSCELEPYSNKIFDHESKRKLVKIDGNYRDMYHLKFDDESYIKIEFDKINTSGKYCMIWAIDSKNGKFEWYGNNYREN